MTQVSANDVILSPFKLGPIQLNSRIVAPPHAAMLGNLFGSPKDAERYVSYWRALAENGTGLLIALNGFVENNLPPGFDATGVGARKSGNFRHPAFVERMGYLACEAQQHGAKVGTQLIVQGGTPHGPSRSRSGPVVNTVPHALTRKEIEWFVREFRASAKQAAAAGLDAVELHANHDDLIEWFLSPLTNQRNDDFGGSRKHRFEFLRRILEEIRDEVGGRLAVGVRLNMHEGEPGGYELDEGLHIAQAIEATGCADYLHLVMGSGWGFPSYIQTGHFRPGAWSSLAGQFKRCLTLPVIYGGRVNDPDVARAILIAGDADLISVGRAHLADPAFVRKAVTSPSQRIRPCIGTNDCINRGLVEGIPFACAANPGVGAGDHGSLKPAEQKKHLLVVGGGPAGLQLAMTAAERGHRVELWEQSQKLGGQVQLATLLPGQESFMSLIDYQTARAVALGVEIHLGRSADVAMLITSAADVIAIATGAKARWPNIEGIDDPRVCDMWQVLRGERSVGLDVAVIVQEDHIAPLAFADKIAREGRRVTLFIQTNGAAPLVSRYSSGTLLGRLSEAGVRLVFMETVTSVELPSLRTRHVFSQVAATHPGFDSVVLACGADADSHLFDALEGGARDVHVLGDAYAPRRIVFATKQGYALGKAI